MKVIFLYYTYPNQIELLSPYFKNAYIAEMSSNIMGEKDSSLGFILSFFPDVIHPYEFIAKSGASKVNNVIKIRYVIILRLRNSVTIT